MEAIDAEGSRPYRKRVSPDDNFQALEIARTLGITVAINLIADPAWDEARFEAVRGVGPGRPEIVHLTVATPYPGTEIWHTESRAADHARLPAVRHPARRRCRRPCRWSSSTRSWCSTQAVINRKHLGLGPRCGARRILAGNLARGPDQLPRGCCGSSTRSTTPRGNTPTTSGRSGTSCRCPARVPATAGSSISTTATPAPVPPRPEGRRSSLARPEGGEGRRVVLGVSQDLYDSSWSPG